MLAKFVIRSTTDKLTSLLGEIRGKRGVVLEAFDPSQIIALLQPNTQLDLGEVVGLAPTSAGAPVPIAPAPIQTTTFAKAVHAGRNKDGRIEVFYVGSDDRISHAWQLQPNGYWSGKYLLGPILPSRTKEFFVGHNLDGRIEVFYVGLEDAVIYHNWQLTPNGYWICEYFLGPKEVSKSKQLVAGRHADGRMDLFSIGLDDAVNHNCQLVANGKWGGGEVPLEPDASLKAKQLAVGEQADGRMELFCIGSDDVLYHKSQLAPNREWNNAEPLGPDMARKAKQVAVGKNADGRMEIFYIGLDNVLYHNWQ
ncbi:MAG: hypothetical protein FJ143_14355, partial [Deltaproteobacteria bacterium]|nr:hypothetical protein [Deltaproteobacteria bacterium]